MRDDLVLWLVWGSSAVVLCAVLGLALFAHVDQRQIRVAQRTPPTTSVLSRITSVSPWARNASTMGRQPTSACGSPAGWFGRSEATAPMCSGSIPTVSSLQRAPSLARLRRATHAPGRPANCCPNYRTSDKGRRLRATPPQAFDRRCVPRTDQKCPHKLGLAVPHKRG